MACFEHLLSPRGRVSLALLGLLVLLTGCHQLHRNRALEASLPPVPVEAKVPDGELRTTHAPYRIEPPDVLLIDALKVVPKPPYRLEPLDVVDIRVTGALPDFPIDGRYQVQGSGILNLGVTYGTVSVMGLTIEEATQAVQAQLSKQLALTTVSISLFQTAGTQQIAGEHQVAADGTVNLGLYGQVYVTGMTLGEAKVAIEEHLSEFLAEPEVAVDVSTFQSKVYYIISDGASAESGDQVLRIPITGNETVLDALSNTGGLAPFSSENMWIARRSPDKAGFETRLPIDWHAITARGSNATNYQILPGDRIYISGNKLTALDTFMFRVISPLERTATFISLASSAIRTLSISFRTRNNNNTF